jgi:hypothetical protein
MNKLRKGKQTTQMLAMMEGKRNPHTLLGENVN